MNADSFFLATLPNLTGGDMFFHPRFDYPLDALYPSADARILASEVRRLISRKTVYDAVVRVRCSEGAWLFVCLCFLSSIVYQRHHRAFLTKPLITLTPLPLPTTNPPPPPLPTA